MRPAVLLASAVTLCLGSAPEAHADTYLGETSVPPLWVEVLIEDASKDGCFTQPATAERYARERIEARGMPVVGTKLNPRLKLVIWVVFSRHENTFCHGFATATVSMPVLWKVGKDKIYMGDIDLDTTSVKQVTPQNVDQGIFGLIDRSVDTLVTTWEDFQEAADWEIPPPSE